MFCIDSHVLFLALFMEEIMESVLKLQISSALTEEERRGEETSCSLMRFTFFPFFFFLNESGRKISITFSALSFLMLFLRIIPQMRRDRIAVFGYI